MPASSDYCFDLYIIIVTSCLLLIYNYTLHITELVAGRVYTATLCSRLVYYTEHVTEQVNFRALFIRGPYMYMYM